MLKLLIDECIPYRVVEELVKRRYNVFSVAENMKSARDIEILSKAVRDERLLITNDKDFGEMVFRSKGKHKGIILLRLNDDSFENTLNKLLDLFKRFGKSLKHKDFVVVTDKSIRIRSSKDY